MKIAVISDIHGNLPALEAVEFDISRSGVDLVVNLGDLLSGPIDPLGVARRLMETGYPTIRGNHDRSLYERRVERMDSVDRFTHGRLGPVHLDWLKSLSATTDIEGEVFLCHGTPTSDTAPWLDNWFDGRTTTLPDEAAVTAEAEGYDFPVMLCGHTHISRIVRLRDGRLIVNPGAVGLQMNFGAPDARYAVIERRGGQWSAVLKAVPYDREAAARAVVANGFPLWAEAIRTGWAGPAGLF